MLPAPSFFVIFLLKFPYMRESAANFSPPVGRKKTARCEAAFSVLFYVLLLFPRFDAVAARVEEPGAERLALFVLPVDIRVHDRIPKTLLPVRRSARDERFALIKIADIDAASSCISLGSVV